MSEQIQIRVIDVIGRPLAVDTTDGQRVHDKIAPLLRENRKVLLSFDGINMVITAFFNAAIGQLYGEFPEEKVDALVEPRELLPVFQSTLDKSRELSKAFFKDPERLKKAIQEIMEMKNKALNASTHPFIATDKILADANFWLYLHGPAAATGSWATTKYSAIYAKLLIAGAQIHLDVLVLGEFINRYARIEASRLSPGDDFKTFRKSAAFPPIASSIAAEAKNIVSVCTRLDHHFAEWNVANLLTDYATGAHDYTDQLLVESCRKHGLSLLTNDADFTEGGLTVFTANGKLLAACP